MNRTRSFSRLLTPAVISLVVIWSTGQAVAASHPGGGPGEGAADGDGIMTNAVSQWPVDVDGLFGNPGGANPDNPNEWADVPPEAFVSPPTNEGRLLRARANDPRANSFLYAAIAAGTSTSPEQPALYLGYEYHPRTDTGFSDGEFIADIVFPVNGDSVGVPSPTSNAVNGTDQPPNDTPLKVKVRGSNADDGTRINTPTGRIDSFFDIFVEIKEPGGDPYEPADNLGMTADVGFGPTPEGNERGVGDHLFIELEVPLLTEGNFFDDQFDERFPGQDFNTGIYSPAPAFWGSDIANDAIDPPASSSTFTINPNGSLTLNASGVPPVPAPSGAVAGLIGFALLGLRRRRPGDREPDAENPTA